MQRYQSGGSVTCTRCGCELYGDESVFESGGKVLCEECFSEDIGCDPCDARDAALDEPDVMVFTAEEYQENQYLCWADTEAKAQREEALICAAFY